MSFFKYFLILLVLFINNLIAKTYWISTENDYPISFIKQDRIDSLIIVTKRHNCNNFNCYLDTLSLKYSCSNDSLYIEKNIFKISNDSLIPDLTNNRQITPFIVDTFIKVSELKYIYDRIDKTDCSKSKIYDDCRGFHSHSPSISLGYSYPSNSIRLSLFSMKMEKSDKFLFEYEFMSSHMLIKDKYNDKFNASSNFLIGMIQFMILYAGVGPNELQDARWDFLWVVYNGRMFYKIDKDGYYKLFIGNHIDPFIFRSDKWISQIFELGFEMNHYQKNISFPLYFSIDYKKPFNHSVGFSINLSLCDL